MRQKRYFVLKNGNLFMSESKESDKANKTFVVKDIEELEIHETKANVFLFLYKNKVYRMEATSGKEAMMWFKSL